MARTREEILDGLTIINGIVWDTCGNCGGTGNYPSSMLPPGRCRFYCWADRTPETFGKLAQGTVDEYVRKAIARDKRHEREQRAMVARMDAIAKARVEAERMLDRAGLGMAWEIYMGTGSENAPRMWEDSRVADVVATVVKTGALSEAQQGFVRRLLNTIVDRAIEEDAQRTKRAAAPAWQAGRVTVEAKLVKVNEIAPYTYGAGVTFKGMFVLEDGRRLYCTIPAGMPHELQQTVTLTVTVEPASDDASMAFGKRPAVAAMK